MTTIETIAIRALAPDRDQELRQHVDRLVDEQNDGEDRQHRRSSAWNPPPIQAWISRSGIRSKRQREQEHQRRARPQPDEQQTALPVRARRRPRSSANAGNISDVAAVPMPKTSAKSFAGTE